MDFVVLVCVVVNVKIVIMLFLLLLLLIPKPYLKNLFGPKMKDEHWREKTELLNLSLSKLSRAMVLLELEFDTKDQVFFLLL